MDSPFVQCFYTFRQYLTFHCEISTPKISQCLSLLNRNINLNHHRHHYIQKLLSESLTDKVTQDSNQKTKNLQEEALLLQETLYRSNRGYQYWEKANTDEVAKVNDEALKDVQLCALVLEFPHFMF